MFIFSYISNLAGADPENVKPWGANSINYQTEPRGVNLFCYITYMGEHGGARPLFFCACLGFQGISSLGR